MDITMRWLSFMGIGTLCFGISLFVLRIPIRTIVVFLVIGLPLVALWLYVDAKSRQQRSVLDINRQACLCPICKHEEAKFCLQDKCACCLVRRGEKVVGHSTNPLL